MEDQYQSNVHTTPGHSGGSKTWLWILLVIILVAGAAGGVYFWQQSVVRNKAAQQQAEIDSLNSKIAELNKELENEKKSSDESTSSKSLTISKSTYTINLPNSSWKESNQTFSEGGESKTRESYYNSTTGDFIQINTDPPGSGYNSDTTWEYKANSAGTGIVLVSQGEMCVKKDEIGFCTADDGKLTIGVKVSGSIKSHNYFIFVGNTKNEKADTAIYKEILSSINFK